MFVTDYAAWVWVGKHRYAIANQTAELAKKTSSEGYFSKFGMASANETLSLESTHNFDILENFPGCISVFWCELYDSI